MSSNKAEEFSEEEIARAKKIQIWTVDYEDLFSHEGNIAEVYLTREEAEKSSARQGDRPNREGMGTRWAAPWR